MTENRSDPITVHASPDNEVTFFARIVDVPAADHPMRTRKELQLVSGGKPAPRAEIVIPNSQPGRPVHLRVNIVQEASVKELLVIGNVGPEFYCWHPGSTMVDGEEHGCHQLDLTHASLPPYAATGVSERSIRVHFAMVGSTVPSDGDDSKLIFDDPVFKIIRRG